ncbi:MAG: N-acetylmuramoyl-L-alanine amidase [Armatimonadetes bacterium]|nr:N-acetylmuramoyl-L-alanine amidase [Armatimonadota bacterium]
MLPARQASPTREAEVRWIVGNARRWGWYWTWLSLWTLICWTLICAGAPAYGARSGSRDGPRLLSLTVDINPGVTCVRLRCSAAVEQPTWGRLRDPERVLLDVPRLRCEGLEEDLPIAAGGIRRVRFLPSDGEGARVEIELERRWEVRLATAERGRQVSLEFTTTGIPALEPPHTAGEEPGTPTGLPWQSAAPELPAPPSSPTQPEAPIVPPVPPTRTELPEAPRALPAHVLSVEVKRDGRVAEVVIHTSRGVRASGYTLAGERPRFYVDLEHTTLGGTVLPAVVPGPDLLTVRAGERLDDPPTTRIVADLASGAVAQLDADEDAGRYRIRIIAPAIRPPAPQQLGVVIALDAGHGGEDSGAIGLTGLMEKDVTLDIVLRLRRLLEKAGFEVVLSRDQDTTLRPADRAAWIRAVRADLLVSVHCDSIDDRPEVTGSSTYFRQDRAGARGLADSVQLRLREAIALPDRGVQPDTVLYPRSGLYVLRHSPRPSVLVETGFISHPTTEQRFRDPEFRERIAQGIAAGIRQYVLAGGLKEVRR